MALKVAYDGTPISVFPKSFSWVDRLGSIPYADMIIKAETGGTIPQPGKSIKIYDDTLEETVNMTVPATTPPGLIYLEEHEGWVQTSLPFNSHADGTLEGVFATMYNLPDISEYVEEDVDVPGGIFYNGPYSAWVEVGVIWKAATKDYHYYAYMWSHSGETFYKNTLISTTILELDVSHRLSITWATAVGGASCSLKMYIDGVLEDSTTGTGTMAGYYEADPNDLFLQGAYAFLGIGYYFGDFRVFLDERTEEEINTWMFARLTGTELTDPDLEAYWVMDEMTGTTLTDSSPNGNNATLYPDEEYSTYMLWGYAPDGWLPGSSPTCAPSTQDLTYFGGFVEDVEIEGESSTIMAFHLKAAGYASLLNRYLVGINFLNPHPGKYYAQYIAQRVLEVWGIGWGCIPSGSPTVLVSDWKNRNAKAALDEVADSTGWVWYIDPYGEMRYHPRGYRSAPFNITASDSPAYYAADSLKVRADKDGYFNRLVARMKWTNEEEMVEAILIIVEDETEIAARAAAEGGDGIYERYQDLPDAITPEHALDQAYGLLMGGSTLGQIVSYTTTTAGLRAGMKQTITLPDWGLSGDYVIEEVRTNFVDGYLIHDVQLSSWKKPKLEPLTKVLSSSINSKTNWRETLFFDGAGKVHEISTSLYAYESVTIEGGDVGAKWDESQWDLTEWV